MISTEYLRLMAASNEWQNRSIYGAADTLNDAQRRADRGAFFGSIQATLNHILWGDQIWLHRLAGTPEPTKPDIAGSVASHADWTALQADRISTDAAILEWGRRVSSADLGGDLSWYSGIVEQELRRPRWALVIQLFNHGTHHRGQVHALLTSMGAKPKDTDVQYLESEHFPW